VSDELDPATPQVSAEATPIELGAVDSMPTAAIAGLDIPRPRHKRRLTIVAAVSALLVAGVGVGAYAGVRAWTGSGINEPETAVPASTAAFLRVDLKPGYRDQIAFDGLAKKFPSDTKSTSALVTDMERRMLKGTDLDFDKDVAPWFGQRAGVGAYAVDADHVVGLVALASTDDAKAKQVLAREQSRNGTKAFGYVVRNGYALLAVGSPSADLQAAATQAANQTAQHDLADDASFKSTVSHLDGHNLLLGYANLAKLGPMLSAAMHSAMSTMPLDPGSLKGDPSDGGKPGAGLSGLSGLTGTLGGVNPLMGASLLKATGTVALGASVVDNGVEIRVHTQGMPATTTHAVDALPVLNAMPSSAVVAAAFNGLDKNGDTVKQLNSVLSGSAGMGGADSGGADSGMFKMMSGLLTNVLTSKLLTVEFSGITAGRPDLKISADLGDQGDAANLAQSLSGLTANPAAGVSIKQDGTVVSATIGKAPTGDPLAGNSLYQAAMKGMGNSSVAVYVDVQRLIASAPSMPEADASKTQMLAPVKAVGLSVSNHGASSDELVRVVITK
jgi:Protein of unknown function (DUF3352)